MNTEGTGFGFPAFGSYKPGSVYGGFTRDNDWFLRHCPHDDIATVGDISKRTGIDERSFANDDETIVSIAKSAGAAFLQVLHDKGMPREKCRGVLLGTCAVENRVLGLASDDLANINESDPEQLVQRTSEKVAQLLGLGDERVFGHNYACSTAAKLTEVGIEEGEYLREGEFYLMLMAEKLGAMLDLQDRNTGFLFGDHVAATALYHGHTRCNILHAFADTVPSDGLIGLDQRKAYGPDGKHHAERNCMVMNNGGKVMEEAGNKMLDAVGQSLDVLAGEPSHIDIIVPHQANARFKRVLQNMWKRRQWSKPPPPVDIDLSLAGNNGSASWARRMAERQKSFQQGQIVMAPFVGAGPYFDPEALSVGNIAIEVGE